MSTGHDIMFQLRQEIAERTRLDPEIVTPDAHFIRDLGLSSLDMLNVLAFAENLYSVRFPDDVLAELTTLDKIMKALPAYEPTGTVKRQ